MNKREKIIAVYVSEDEKRRIEAAARAKGIPAAVYLRMLVLADLSESTPVQPTDKPTKKP